MDVPSLPDSLPLWARIAIYGLLFVAVGITYVWKHASELKKADPDVGKQVVLQAASFADMSLFRQAADDVAAIRKNTAETQADTRAIRTMMEEDDAAERDDARLRLLVEEIVEKRRAPRAPRRRRKTPPAAE